MDFFTTIVFRGFPVPLQRYEADMDGSVEIPIMLNRHQQMMTRRIANRMVPTKE
jgi:hypothetical protein